MFSGEGRASFREAYVLNIYTGHQRASCVQLGGCEPPAWCPHLLPPGQDQRDSLDWALEPLAGL